MYRLQCLVKIILIAYNTIVKAGRRRLFTRRRRYLIFLLFQLLNYNMDITGPCILTFHDMCFDRSVSFTVRQIIKDIYPLLGEGHHFINH
jgi:hypothetical protein